MNTVVKCHSDWGRNHYVQRTRKFKKFPLKYGDIVILGNSLVEEGGNWKQKLNIPNARNRGLSGDVTEGVLKRLKEIIHYKPEKVAILIGINDINAACTKRGAPVYEYVADNILKITDRLYKGTPDTKIYVQTILPTANELVKNDISKVNEILKENGGKGVFTIIDLHSAFCNNEGLLSEEYTYDGIHLNLKGYDLWVELLKPYLDN